MPHPAARLLLVLASATSLTAEAADFAHAQPLLERYCYECHSGADAESGLDYAAMDAAAFAADGKLLEDLIWVVEEGEMPPSRAAQQPPAADRAQLLAWAQALHQELASLRPDDPGVVVMGRLNHREYGYVIRDLTGVAIDLDDVLTPDSAAGEGFLNVGAAHTLTAPQLENYLQAAKRVLAHARIVPGMPIAWFDSVQPPATTDAELVEAIEQGYLTWWDRHQLVKGHPKRLERHYHSDLAAYLLAAWQWEHHAALGLEDLAAVATGFEREPLFPIVIERMHAFLGEASDDNPYRAELRARWRALPGPEAGSDAVWRATRAIADWAEARIDGYRFSKNHLSDFERDPGWDTADRRRQWGENEDGIRRFDILPQETAAEHLYLLITDAEDGNEHDWVRIEAGELKFGDRRQAVAEAIPALIGPDGTRHAWQQDGDAQVIVVQAPTWLRWSRPATAEAMSLTARLDPARGSQATVQVQLLDREPTADELHFFPTRWLGSRASERMVALRRQVGGLRPIEGNHGVIDEATAFAPLGEEMARRLGAPWPPQVPSWRRGMLNVPVDEVIERFDAETRQELDRWLDLLRGAAVEHSPAALRDSARDHLAGLVTRAWRRPPSDEEIAELLAFFDELRAGGAGYEAALEGPLTVALCSPHFLYRVRRGGDAAEPRALSGHDLAERLSFTLWGSLPDAELLELAADGRLHDPVVLAAQVERMLEDERSAAFALEFAGQWLQVGDIAERVSPDAQRFEAVSAELVAAMQREPLAFLTALLRENRPLTEVIDAEWTMLNGPLAEHYGIAGVQGKHFRRVALPEGAPRGGVLTMAGPLAKFSTPLRTSPVKRGAWVVEYVLGQHLPAPPANVPQISDDERNEAGESIREQLEAHRSNPACFDCHDRIDPLGIALEHFDAVGRWRERDRAGQAIDTEGRFVASGEVVSGIDGLRAYLTAHQDRFLRHFCEQLVGYGLGRVRQPSDEPLIEAMLAALEADDLRPRAAVVTLVTSPQFRTRRDSDHAFEEE